MKDNDIHRHIQDLYTAYNARDSRFVTERMTVDVRWPRAFKGGHVHGREAVEAYWQAQWQEIDPRVEPMSIELRHDGLVDVTVHQVVRDLSGKVVADSVVHHVYRFDAGRVARMDIVADD
jgi:ketosteroid isomerase-like protein